MQTTQDQPLTPAWQLQDAKSQFSTLVELALRGVPQHVTRRGKQAVVVLSEQDFSALQRSAADPAGKPASLIDHLLAIPKMPIHDPNDLTDINDLELQPRDVDFS
ncbi:MAG: type II toxin-antitoxin system Phd/YefM family antitoxin [Rhodoferax sp.]|jgi:prevent-host-death family protein|nr:type II toxin-antitoxin system Phd/YefM family antitoxin [Rhodoferax sp.]